jgi:1-pyrroline-5-carboxylate dehydrogenase
MFNGIFNVPQPANEPVLDYAPGSVARDALKSKLQAMLGQQVKERLLSVTAEIKMGDVCDFRNFMGAVIDQNAFAAVTGYID